MIYKEKPDIVRVKFGYVVGDEDDVSETVYLVGVGLNQVLEALTRLKDESPAVTTKKTRKTRRTKAQMRASEAVAQTPDATPEVAMAGAARGKAWAD